MFHWPLSNFKRDKLLLTAQNKSVETMAGARKWWSLIATTNAIFLVSPTFHLTLSTTLLSIQI